MRLAVLVLIAGCGRIGIEPRIGELDAAVTPDVTADARVCPADTTELMAGSTVCIEKTERGNDTWTNAKAACEGLGRRLCADAEWLLACDSATGLVDMANDAASEWEWMAEETGGVALKRGFAACGDMSSHEILVDPYDYRCCVDK